MGEPSLVKEFEQEGTFEELEKDKNVKLAMSFNKDGQITVSTCSLLSRDYCSKLKLGLCHNMALQSRTIGNNTGAIKLVLKVDIPCYEASR